MKVSELIKALQGLGTDAQDLPVTFIRDEFPRNIKSLQKDFATPVENHWWISYAPEIDKADGEDVQLIKYSKLIRSTL